MSDTNKPEPLSLSVPTYLKNILRRYSKLNRRSMNAEVLICLQEKFVSEGLINNSSRDNYN